MTAAEAILSLLRARGTAKTICPSEAARRLDAEGWRDRMDEVRRAGAALASDGAIRVTQQGRVVPPDAPGPIRYGLPSGRVE